MINDCMELKSKYRIARQKGFKLKKNAELFKSLFDEAIDGIVFWDQDGNILMANQSALNIFECTSEDFLTKKLWEFVFKKDEQYRDFIQQFYEKKAIRDETLFLMPNGQFKYLEFTSKMHFVDGYNMTIFRNNSYRYQMEQNLRDSEDRFRKVFEGSFDGMVLWNWNHHVVDINPVAAHIMGLSRKDIVGRDFRDVYQKNTAVRNELESHINELMESGTADSVISVVKSGRYYYYEVCSKGNLTSNLNLSVIRDVTERRALQEQLQKSDTLMVVGELAAGIAHEIRNPMTALKGFIQLLESSIKEDHSLYFKVITSELKRIESTITEFLVLAKPQDIQYHHHDIHKIMMDTLDLLKGQAMMHNIQFDFIFEQALPKVFCEPNQMKQVFINIIKNAIEVMPDGGTIRIQIQKGKRNFVHVIIQDEGEGIPKNKIKKLGEPFYTTKERGTGLGLMVSFKIIKDHKGIIDVESKVGVGTKFHIHLPANK
ncbi:PAS domain-containing sensor histidine kinase [Heyndrickxia sp. NPDC080065]|uniref:PAS domain-containing sensor histidine kinase n=1 Tax=Heyndrickxia sp. NPDC080065 TaxID=3390568 RepID=UPI003CFE04AE